MKARLLYALLSASVAVAASVASSAAILKFVPKGDRREAVERYLVAPGEMLYERLHESKRFRKLEERTRDAAEDAKDRIEEAGEGFSGLPQAERLPHVYNVAAWALAGFFLCLLMTLFFGVSSLKSALALGIKVTLTLAFLQGALVFAGILVYQRLKG
ncbi:MAG: hypothetical protein WC728_04610 [Elusimicrobiota bacterium]